MWIGSCEIVLPDGVLPHGAVRVEEGFIAEIAEQPIAAPDIDGHGLLLLPGLVDLHGDMIDREIQPRPGATFPIEMAVVDLDKRHAACGITTALVAVSFYEDPLAARGVRSEETAKEIITTIVALKPFLATEMRVHARFEINNSHAEPILRDLVRNDAINLVSLMDHTPGQGQSQDVEHYVRLVARDRGLDEASVAAQAKALVAEREAKPDIWDNLLTFIDLARQKRLIIASHDDHTPEKVAMMSGLGASISEFPVSLAVAHEAKSRGLHTVMGAPNALRGTSNSGNLSAREALHAGALDALASDYHASALLHAAFVLEADGLKPLHDSVGLVTLAPATAAGLTDRGAIAVGKRADLVMVDRSPVLRVVGTFRCGRLIHGEPRVLSAVASYPRAGAIRRPTPNEITAPALAGEDPGATT